MLLSYSYLNRCPIIYSVERFLILICFRLSLEKIKHSIGTVQNNLTVTFLLISSLKNLRMDILAGS